MHWGLFDDYTVLIAEKVGDNGNWLAWFYSENDMGSRGMKAGHDGKLKAIKTLSDLYWLINE